MRPRSMRSIDLGKRRGSRRRRVCSDSTNYAPAANAKCMRNKPRARMPPNGRNCISPLLPPSPSSIYMPRVRASRRCLMHARTKYSKILAGTNYKVLGASSERARVNVPRESLVSFSASYCIVHRRSPSLPGGRSSFLALSFSLILPSFPSLPIRDFFFPFLSPCIILVTRRGGRYTTHA